MPNTTIQYSLEVTRESVTSTMKGMSDSIRQTGSAADVTFKQLVSGLNASTRASAELRKDIAQTESQAKRSSGGLEGLWKSVAGGTLAAGAVALVAKGVLEVGQAALTAGKNALDMAGDWEQSRIAFTTFLGSAPAMKTFMKDLQSFANVSPFTYTDLEKNAKFLLAMGTAGNQVLPVLKDVSAAVAAGGGGADALGNVSAAYAKINAEGKTSAIYLNEITRNGVPAFTMLAEYMHKNVEEVRQLASEGQITADIFDKAFNTYVVAHYGDMLKQQSQTFKGLESTIEDVGGAFNRAIGAPIIAAIEPELKRLTDELTSPEVTATLAEWGTNIGKAAFAATTLWDNVAAGARAAFTVVKPFFDALGQLMGSLPDAPSLPDPVAPMKASMTDLGTATESTTKKAGDFTAEIQDAQDRLTAMRRGQQDASYVLDTQIQAERQKLSVLNEQFAVQDRATSIARLQQKIDKDRLLSKDVYSSAGQSAAKRLVDEQQQLADMQVAAGREGQKAQLNDKISGLEGQKKAQDHAAQLNEQAVQDEVTRWQRLGKTLQDDADRRAKLATQAAAQEKQRQEQQAKDVVAADAREDASFKLRTSNSTAFTKQLKTDGAAQNKVLIAFEIELDKIAQLLRFKDAKAAFEEIKFQFEDLGAFLSTHWDAIGRKMTHVIEGGGIAALKLRAMIPGVTNSPEANAAIKKWDREEAGVNAGMSMADQAYAVERRALEQKYGKTLTPITGTGPSSAPPSAGTQATDPVYGSTRNKMFNVMEGNSPIAPVPVPPGKATGGGGVGMGSIFGSPDLGIDPATGKPYPRRAGGGPVSAGMGYVIKDRPDHQPELFVPGSDGYIFPPGQGGLGGGGDEITVNLRHLCPQCLEVTQERVTERVIRRRGSQLVGDHVMRTMG